MKELICKLADWAGCIQPYKTHIKVLETAKDVCVQDVSDLINEKQRLRSEYNDLTEEKINLEDRLKEIGDESINPTTVPNKSILYSRKIYLNKKWYNAKISIRNFFTVNDDVYKDKLKDKGLFITCEEEVDQLVPAIYNLAKQNYKYVYDSTHGFSEYWLFPWELDFNVKKGLGGDCEDWSHKIVSMLRIAGLPANRVFASCGYTRSGFGHSTVYVRDYAGVWRHLNSTRPHYKRPVLSDYPSKDDEADTMGIRPGGFWFSANDRISISKFETAESQKLFNKESALKAVSIKDLPVGYGGI